MRARKKKNRAMAPVGDLLTLMEHAMMQQAAPALPVVAPIPEPVVASQIATAPTLVYRWSRVDVEKPPTLGAVVRVDGGEWMVWRGLYLIRERREAKAAGSVLSIPRDYALLVPYPDHTPLAPMQTIALERIEVRGEAL